MSLVARISTLDMRYVGMEMSGRIFEAELWSIRGNLMGICYLDVGSSGYIGWALGWFQIVFVGISVVEFWRTTPKHCLPGVPLLSFCLPRSLRLCHW